MSLNSSSFVALLVTVQILYNLISHVLEFNRLNEIGVPHKVILTIQFISLHVLVMFYNTDLFLMHDAV